VPRYRIILSRGSSFIYQIIVDRHISTYTALFRGYRREVTRRVPFYSTGFLAGTELMVNAMLMGYKVAEYPTVLHSRAAGASKAKIFRIIRAHLRFQWSVLLQRLKLAPLPEPLEQEKAA
jgi:dolichol-phosphate mannosyltransferase